jgi:hypothetical protein
LEGVSGENYLSDIPVIVNNCYLRVKVLGSNEDADSLCVINVFISIIYFFLYLHRYFVNTCDIRLK